MRLRIASPSGAGDVLIVAPTGLPPLRQVAGQVDLTNSSVSATPGGPRNVERTYLGAEVVKVLTQWHLLDHGVVAIDERLPCQHGVQIVELRGGGVCRREHSVSSVAERGYNGPACS